MLRKLFPPNPAKLFREPLGRFLDLGLEQSTIPQPVKKSKLVYLGSEVIIPEEEYRELVEENHRLRHEVAQMEAVILSCQTAIRNGGFG
ncbi:hypothetical protein BN1356_02539 [Streptococcus varani]|uniref:Uncharacterized protein n=1 Tax=Streptococcus varani TaxID=1608583 RepID=A0A0E3WFV2_9STRE|nr:hypothetical protein [Streptococcus varani]CQR26180.1 hypothetical protein BN1356_02539 [Streptococcus varani]